MCLLSEEHSRDSSKAEVIGGETLIGQIPTFMDELKMSYKEVFETIPYRMLLFMQKDKQRIAYGDVEKEVSDDEFMKSHNIKFSK